MKKMLFLLLFISACSSLITPITPIIENSEEIIDEKITLPYVWQNEENSLRVTIYEVFGEYTYVDYEEYKEGNVENYELDYYMEYIFTIKITGKVELLSPTKIETGQMVDSLSNVGVVSMFLMDNGFWAINSIINEDGSFYGEQTHYLDYKPELNLSYFFLFDTTNWTPDY